MPIAKRSSQFGKGLRFIAAKPRKRRIPRYLRRSQIHTTTAATARRIIPDINILVLNKDSTTTRSTVRISTSTATGSIPKGVTVGTISGVATAAVTAIDEFHTRGIKSFCYNSTTLT